MKILKFIKEKKLSLSIYLLFFAFLIISIVLRNINPEIYPVSIFLMILIFVLSQYFNFEYRYLIGSALVMLIACPFLLIGGYEKLAEYFANYVYGFLVLGVVGYFLDNLREKVKKKGYFKIYKIIFLSIFIIFLVFYIFVGGKDYIKTIPTEVKEIYMRTFHKEVYYSFKEEVSVNGEVLRGNIEIAIDNPQDGDDISGLFILEGWAIEHNGSIKDSVIDMIEIFLDGKPREGKFIGYTEPNVERIELGEMYGEQFNNCGFRLLIDSQEFENGIHIIYVYAHSSYFGWDFVDFNIYVNN
ncbi:hypothetical protein ES703_63371 [subsurface metagenome]